MTDSVLKVRHDLYDSCDLVLEEKLQTEESHDTSLGSSIILETPIGVEGSTDSHVDLQRGNHISAKNKTEIDTSS